MGQGRIREMECPSRTTICAAWRLDRGDRNDLQDEDINDSKRGKRPGGC